MDTKEIHARSGEVCEELGKADVIAAPYKRSPLENNELFTVSMFQNTLRLWNGLAEIETRLSKPRRQAVLNVEEPSRKVEQLVQVGNYDRARVPGDRQLRADAIDRFPVTIPDAKFRTGPIRRIISGDGVMTNARVIISVPVTATAPPMKMSLLVGWDETRQFISALPEMVDSVKEAHDVLRGDVRAGMKRQGEWFFLPATPHEQVLISNYLTTGHKGAFTSDTLEGNSHHHASCLIRVAGERYVIGVVHDTRGTRHAPLVLPTWHRVQRNREVTMPESVTQRPVRWD